jgi:ubiquitin C-terminal hydrolase
MEHEELEIKCDKCKHGTAQLRHVVGKAPALLVLHYSRFVFMDGDLKKIGFKVGLE